MNEITCARPCDVTADAGYRVGTLDSLPMSPRRLYLLVLCQEHFHSARALIYIFTQNFDTVPRILASSITTKSLETLLP